MVRMIDVFVGLLLVFTTFSLVASAIIEVAESVLRKRADDLEAGLKRLLGDRESVAHFLKHPLISALQTRDGKRPSYIPSETFAIAALDLFAGVGTATTNVASVVQTMLKDDSGPAARALHALGVHSELSLAAWRRGVEGWFDAAMDRMSAVYKRRTQWFLLVLGLIIGGALNVDAINIAQTLAADPELRGRVVALAAETSARAGARKSDPDAGDGGTGAGKAFGASEPTEGSKAVVPPEGAQSIATGGAAVPSTASSAVQSLEQLQALGLPIGWTSGDVVGDPRAFPRTPWDVLKKIVGILATAFAITMGAPFWFDILSRVMQLRSAVKPEAPARGEG